MTMMAEGWKGLVWFVTGVAVALGLLLVPLQVAAERKKLDKTVSDITDARREIRSLETEFDTRANLAQLEKWNGDTLGLSSPGVNQFVSDERALASIDVHQGALPGQPGIRMASLIIPTLPGVMPTGVSPSETSPSSVSAPSIPVAPAVQVAHVVLAAAHTDIPGSGLGAVAGVRDAAVSRGKAQAMAMLDRKLLSDSTLGDILSGARMEASAR